MTPGETSAASGKPAAALRRLNLVRDLRELGATRAELTWLAVLTMLYALLEGVGMGLLLPVFDYLAQRQAGAGAETRPAIEALLRVFGVAQGRYELVFLLAAAFVVLTLRSLCQYAQGVRGAALSLKVAANLRKAAVDGFLHGDFAFLSTTGSGRLLSALTLEAARAGEALAGRIVFLTSCALLVVYLGLMVWLAPRLAPLLVPVFGITVVALRRQRHVVRSHGRMVATHSDLFTRRASELLRGMEVVKMRVQERTAAAALDRTIDDMTRSSLSIERWRLLIDIGLFPVLVLSACGMLFLAVEVLGLDLPSIGLFLFIVMRLAPQFSLLNSLWSHLQACLASFHDLVALITTARRQRESWGGGRPHQQLTREISLQSVVFSYGTRQGLAPAIDGLTATIPAGSFTAVVGCSGAGKSTLIKLLAGFYRPQAGAILIDGVSLDALDLSTWRRHVAYLGQEPFLFDDTIRANISFGLDRPLSDARLREVLRRSHAEEFVDRLPEGPDTWVGEGGRLISQGQRQRLALAHVLAVEPQVILLDEPTSALDAASEEAISDTLNGMRGFATTIVIAHRLSTIRRADQVLVLDQGRLVAQGVHEELLASSAPYRTVFARDVIK